MRYVIARQNSDKGIQLLAAQRTLYSQAKRVRFVRVAVALLLSLALWGVSTYFPVAKPWIAMVGVIWFFIDLWVTHHESDVTRTAALVQEEFDTYVFELDWNEVLTGQRVSPEVIIDAAARHSNRTELRNWYPAAAVDDHTRAILLCQRVNVVWDWRLHLVWGRVIGVATAGLLTVLLVAAVVGNVLFQDALLVLLPLLPVFRVMSSEVHGHCGVAKEKKAVEQSINRYLSSESVSISVCRQIQDRLFISRNNVSMVPDWLHGRLAARLNKLTTAGTHRISSGA